MTELRTYLTFNEEISFPALKYISGFIGGQYTSTCFDYNHHRSVDYEKRCNIHHLGIQLNRHNHAQSPLTGFYTTNSNAFTCDTGVKSNQSFLIHTASRHIVQPKLHTQRIDEYFNSYIGKTYSILNEKVSLESFYHAILEETVTTTVVSSDVIEEYHSVVKKQVCSDYGYSW